MNKKYIYIFSAVIAVLVAILGAAFWYITKQKDDLAAIEEMMEFEKEEMMDEYEDLAMQYDGYQINISNDSLIQELAQEKQRVKDLLEELRITKVTDGRKIAELKKELSTVRAVMKQYVAQIDSLDRTNKQLVKENKQVREQYQAISQQNQSLHEEKTRLTEVVNRASMMEVTGFAVTPLNKRDRKTSIFNAIQKLQFDFMVAKNVTVAPGEKMLYAQLRRPDGELMLKSENNHFTFEGSSVPFSLKKSFVYEGEEVALTLYWPVEEILQKGLYTIDFFIDGNMVGSFPFTLD